MSKGSIYNKVKSAYKEPAIRNVWLWGTDFCSPIFTKEQVHYMFIRNSSYKEQIYMVLMCFLSADFTVNMTTSPRPWQCVLQAQKEPRPHQFQVGMKLEALVPGANYIGPATVTTVINNRYLFYQLTV